MNAAAYVPDRNDIVLINFEPQQGREMGKTRPALVLSSAAYSKATGLMMVAPISTSIRGGLLEVPIQNGMDRASVVVASQVHTMDWRERAAQKIGEAEQGVLEETLKRLIPLLGAEIKP